MSTVGTAAFACRSTEEILKRARAAVPASYQATAETYEVVNRKPVEQTISLKVEHSDRRDRIEAKQTQGPTSIAKAVWNGDRPDKVEVELPGMGAMKKLGPFGKALASATRLDIDDPKLRTVTNHPITHSGLEGLLELVETNVQRAEEMGGLERSDWGLEDGLYRIDCQLPDGFEVQAPGVRPGTYHGVDLISVGLEPGTNRLLGVTVMAGDEVREDLRMRDVYELD